jgi:hypothetical protein
LEKKAEPKDVSERLEPVVEDAERLMLLHAELLQSELRQSATQASSAMASLGVGTGLAVAGGLLGSLAVVHALHRATRLPLWGCYGLVGGMLGAAGAGLVGSGVRQISTVDFIPRETLATLKDDLEWIKKRTK